MADGARWDGVPQYPAEFPPGGTPAEPADEVRPAALPDPADHVPTSPDLVVDSVLSEPLIERMRVAARVTVVIELSIRYPGGLNAASDRVVGLVAEVGGDDPARNGNYLTVTLGTEALKRLIHLDQSGTEEQASERAAGPQAGRTDAVGAPGDATQPQTAERDATAADGAGPIGAPSDASRTASTLTGAPRGAIHRIWPNFGIGPLIHRSIVTTKCHAAHRSFNAVGKGVVWAVLDSGIQGDHPHFAKHQNTQGLPHKSFVHADDARALVDEAGHGTHVAGILAGELAAPEPPPGGEQEYLSAATWYRDTDGTVRGKRVDLTSLAGMAPATKLLSCQVLREDESGDITALLAALQYINELNAGGRDLVVHGVNISVGHPFDPTWFATGLTPVCREVDLLVRSGVVVVVAAGNTGYGYARDPRNNDMRLGFDMTINDPGNAALGITVGSTSCSPHQTGVSFFSSKGPTGDGRMKPDLVAPGERVISAAAGKLAVRARQAVPGALYIENSGTSMAAPHVAGVAAGFLSVHREFIGNPDRVRDALMSTATDLGRSRHFQGAGLVDAMRAIQSV